jgi:DNA-directed RNA polymerase specialized sigma24 family protein
MWKARHSCSVWPKDVAHSADVLPVANPPPSGGPRGEAQRAAWCGSHEWDYVRADLSDISDEIHAALMELAELYERRADLVLDAAAEGMPQREIGYELGVSHTAVQKILDSIDPFKVARTGA